MKLFDDIAERRIQAAQEAGEFDRLPGMGRPLLIHEDFSMPIEVRMAHRRLIRTTQEEDRFSLAAQLRLRRLRALVEQRRDMLRRQGANLRKEDASASDIIIGRPAMSVATAVRIIPSADAPFGCRIEGVDLASGIDSGTFALIEQALHQHLVVCISGVPFGPQRLVEFGRFWGPLEISVARSFHHGQVPEVTVLSNRTIDGKPEGSPDAGQMWHTDMSYNRIGGRASVLHAHQVPMRDGRALGDTAFRDMHRAYEALPADMRARLDTLEAVHEFEKVWTQMRARGSSRPEYTQSQRLEKPPVVHPVVIRHPWTGRKALFVNRGLTQRILGVSDTESEQLLDFLYAHTEDNRFEFRHVWRVGDTLVWDNFATIHLATGGYGTDTPRVMIRTQVLGNEALYRQANGSLGGRLLD